MPAAAHHGPMHPEPWPRRATLGAAHLATVVRDIRSRDDEAHDLLLTDLARAAWPTEQAQRQ